MRSSSFPTLRLLAAFVLFLCVPGTPIRAQSTYATRQTISGTLPLTGNWTGPERTNRWLQWTCQTTGWYTIEASGGPVDYLIVQASWQATATGLVSIGDNEGEGVVPITFYATAGAVGIFQLVADGITGSTPLTFSLRSAATPSYAGRGLSFAPTPVNVTASDQTTTVTFRVLAPPEISDDELTGYLSLGRLSLPDAPQSTFYCPSPEVTYTYWDATDRVSGTTQDGTYHVTLTVPRGLAPGLYAPSLEANYYDVETDTFWDLSDGGAPNASLPLSAGIALSVANTGPADLAGPVLKSFSLNAATFNFTGLPASVTLTGTATITDDVSGLTDDLEDLSFLISTSELSSHVERTSGTALNGVYSVQLTLDLESAFNGTWPLVLEMRDRAGRASTYGTALAAALQYYELSCMSAWPAGAPTALVVQASGRNAVDAFLRYYDDAGQTFYHNATEDDDNDGIPLLLEYAFGMEGDFGSVSYTSAADPFGLPTVTNAAAAGQPPRLHLTYVRRTSVLNPGITYTPQVSSNGSTWITLAGTELITPLGVGWERVTVEEATFAGKSRIGRVKITRTPL